jgi:fatty acid desaturase
MAPFAAGLLVRLFMIQHECGHGAFLPSKIANDWIGRAIGVVTMSPYDHWRRSHAIHHATSGNLDRRGIGDIRTLTVREYLSRGWRDRLRYRLYRHPQVMFGVGPIYLFLIENRLPFGFMRKGSMPWLTTMTTNAGILLAAALLIWVAGLIPRDRECRGSTPEVADRERERRRWEDERFQIYATGTAGVRPKRTLLVRIRVEPPAAAFRTTITHEHDG